MTRKYCRRTKKYEMIMEVGNKMAIAQKEYSTVQCEASLSEQNCRPIRVNVRKLLGSIIWGLSGMKAKDKNKA